MNCAVDDVGYIVDTPDNTQVKLLQRYLNHIHAQKEPVPSETIQKTWKLQVTYPFPFFLFVCQTQNDLFCLVGHSQQSESTIRSRAAEVAALGSKC